MTASQRAIRHIHAAANEAGIDHDRLHGWAVASYHDSLKDLDDDDLDDMARRIKADPEIMAAWFDAYAPDEWEAMDPAENAEPGDPSTLRHLFTPEQLADLNADADRIQRVERFRQ